LESLLQKSPTPTLPFEFQDDRCDASIDIFGTSYQIYISGSLFSFLFTSAGRVFISTISEEWKHTKYNSSK